MKTPLYSILTSLVIFTTLTSNPSRVHARDGDGDDGRLKKQNHSFVAVPIGETKHVLGLDGDGGAGR